MDFLREKIADQTVLDRLHVLVTNLAKVSACPRTLCRLRRSGEPAGGVPTYIHKVPSFNAADVWMMREFAGVLYGYSRD